ncbi:MAG: protein kinase [Pirellulales bacterium]
MTNSQPRSENAPSPADAASQSSPDSPRDMAPPTLDFGGEERAEQLVQILDEYLANLKAGRQPDRSELLAAHPELADQLAACLAGIEFIQRAEPSARGGGAADVAERTLGDFRILREVGRGGMGAVYEAEQVSLGRRVALKVLRFGGVSDPEALDRFKREAETVARLHHTNIVPIFAVGSDQGVNFYAMQFIEGQSLAQRLEAQMTADNPRGLLPVEEVLSWGLQASEALAHAHDRNVIHRDVKPSNLLIDQEGRIWLTDFGLARRLDDVTLSMTGALLGTPRYMSPEQASAKRVAVDRRTDLYSLGATLYELLSGRPAFSGDSPHHVIQQILSTEPENLRQLRPDIPRDVETVVMKCLAKEAEGRYATARDLASDLRACLEHRPIKARRPTVVERAVRWIRESSHAVRVASAAAAITLLATFVLAYALQWHDLAHRVELSFTTDAPPLTAQLFEANGELEEVGNSQRAAVVTPVPTDRPVVVRDGEYALQTLSLDRWSRTQQLTVERGESRRFDLSLDDQQLWMPVETEHWFGWATHASGGSLLLFGADELTCEAGVPKSRRWKLSFRESLRLAFPDSPGIAWPWFNGGNAGSLTQGSTLRAPWVVRESVDVNGDGVGDLIIAGRHQAFLIALSGVDGRAIWGAARGPDLQWKPQAEIMRPVRSGVNYRPRFVEDRDGDGIRDLLVTWADTGDQPGEPPRLKQGQVALGRRHVELMSGATGKSIWDVELSDAWFSLGDQEAVPAELQWLVGASWGASSGSSGGTMLQGRHYVRDENRHVERNGVHVYLPSTPRDVTINGRKLTALVAGQHLVLLDPVDGKRVECTELPGRPDREGEWGDVDGDGSADFVWSIRRAPPAGARHDRVDLAAWSVQQARLLWRVSLQARFPRQESWTTLPPRWPLVVDLNEDGAAEIVAPGDNTMTVAGALPTQVPWGELVTLDGKSGQTLWTQRLATSDMQIDHFAVGPDIDGDGWREVYAATLSMNPMRVFVDCLSGKDGAKRWVSGREVESTENALGSYLQETLWWNAGEDGGPQWIVVVDGLGNNRKGIQAFAFSARTGRITRTRRDVGIIEPLDADADGVDDLLVFRPRSPETPEDGGLIDCVRGVASEPWNRLGPEGAPIADLDGDGVRDLLRDHQFGSLAVRSGATGRPLWSVSLPGLNLLRAASLVDVDDSTNETGDVDGDGITDLLVWQWRQFGASLPPFAVVSGGTGRLLWMANSLASQVSGGVYARQLVDFDRDGEKELAIIFAGDFAYGSTRVSLSSGDLQWWLIVVSARHGKVLWKQPLSEPFGSSGATPGIPGASFPFRPIVEHLYDLLRFADVDGDGSLELLTLGLMDSQQQLELRAYQGRDGSLLWRHPLPLESPLQEAVALQRPAEWVDFEGDGRSEAVVLEVERLDGASGSETTVRLQALDGATGELRWSWKGSKHTPGQLWPPFVMSERRGVSEIVVLRAGERRQRVAVCLTGEPAKLVVFDERGQTTESVLSGPVPAARLWPCDVDGDKVDELAVVVGGELWLIDPREPTQPRWRLADRGKRLARISSVRSRLGSVASEIVAVGMPGDGVAVGVEGATGRITWMCAAPIPRDNQGIQSPQIVQRLDNLGSSQTGSKPWVFFQYNQTSYCRRASWANSTAASEVQVSATRKLTDAEPLVASRPVGRDPRWARELPWKLPSDAWEFVGPTLVGGAMLSLILVIAPGIIVMRMIRRRQWGTKTLFALATLVGIALVVSSRPPPFGWWGDLGPLPGPGLRWIIALAATPPVILLLRFGAWGLRREWRKLAWWGSAILVTSALWALFLLLMESVVEPRQPEEYYLLDGWYSILGQGFYVVSLLQPVLSSLAEWWQRRRSQRANASDDSVRVASVG